MRTTATVLLLWLALPVFAQDFSNKGKDFWVGYGSHCDMYNTNGTINTTTGGPQQMVLYFATDSITNITVSIPGLGFTQTYSNIPANSIFETPTLPKTGATDARLASEGTSSKGIHIVSDQPIVAYAHIYNGSRSGATLLFPTNTLGKEYYSLNMTQNGGQAWSYCYFFVVATDTGTTTVKITPSANTQTMTAGTTYTFNLTQGQIFNALGYINGNSGVDLTGSKIESIASGTGRCKPIAVFSGSGKINLNCPINGTGSADNYIAQSFPKTAWGKNYLTAPTYGMPFNYFRIAVSDPTAVVQLNGVTLTGLVNNFYYQIAATNQPNYIQSDKPITVAQYITTTGACGNNVGIPSGNGDPEVIYLSPIEQNISKVLLYATPHFAITSHFTTLIIPNGGTALSSFRVDGAAPSASFVVHPQNTAYSYLQQPLSVGTHTIQSDSGFNAIAYGYGSVESYGYNAGTNVRDLYQFISIKNPYATVPFPAACQGSPFFFSIIFPYEPTQIVWKFYGLFPDTTINTPLYDSTWFVNGRQVYRYQLPSPYTINSIGSFPIQVLAQNPSPDGCSGQQEINYTLQVFAPPVADFMNSTVCFPNPIQFTDISNTNGRSVIHRYWDFGDASNTTSNNPSHTYSNAGSYNVKYTIITDVGCLSDTIMHPVILYPLPTGNISGTTEVCKDAPPPAITFTGADGTAPYTFSYTINGGPVQNITSTGNTATIYAPTNTPGTFIYSLVSVQDGSPAACSQNQGGTATIIVNPLPTATIAGTIEVCKDSPSPMIVFTGAGSTAPYIFSYTINGGPVLTATSSGNTATVTVPTNIAGIFIYSLVSVQDGSATSCSQAQSGSATVTINPLPFASISGNTAVCRNTTPPLITFTGSGATAPYIFTYSVNGGAPLTVTSTGNIATVAVPTGTAGSFVYTLISVQDASPTTCSQLQSGTVTVIVHPLPAPSFTSSNPRCAIGLVNFSDGTLPNATGLTNWYWEFGDPVSGPLNNSNLQNPSHFFASAGNYIIRLVATNTNGCVSDTLTQTLLINPKPVAGYIIPDVCLSDTYAQFTDTSQIVAPDNLTNWNWNFGDPISGPANISTLQNPQHSYTAVGVYQVELIITTNNGCRDTITQNVSVNGSFPLANFNILNAAALCANDSVAISEASSVFPGVITKVIIYWDNSGAPASFDLDDYPYTGKIYKHLYPNFQAPLTKNFIIRYRAFSGGICVKDTLKTIIVNAAPSVRFDPMPDICLDTLPRQITQAYETGAVPGVGIFSGPGVSPSGIFNPSVAGPGTHTIKFLFIGSGGGCADSASQTIKVLAPPVANFTSSLPACEKNSISFTQNSTTPEGIITNWIWDFGDGSPVQNNTNGNTVTHQFANWGNYDVKLWVITSKGCVSVKKILQVHIDPLPKPNFNIPASICLPNALATFNNSTTIADGSVATLSYLWNFGDPGSGPVNISTAINPSHTYISTGNYTVNLQVSSLAGCIKDTNIILNTIHAQPLANFSVSPSYVCIGSSFRLNDNSDQQGGIVTQWNWDMGDGQTRSINPLNYTYRGTGNYTVTLYTLNNFGCRSNNYSMALNVYPYPVVDAGPDRFVLEGGQITLQATATGNQLHYRWTPPLHFISSDTLLYPTILGVNDITYQLKVIAQGGCADSSTVFIKVLKYPAIPNIFSPNGDGIHDTWTILYLNSYPGCTVDIVNRYGQPVFHSEGYNKPWDGTVNGKPAPSGTYYYVVDPKNGRKKMTGFVDLVR